MWFVPPLGPAGHTMQCTEGVGLVETLYTNIQGMLVWNLVRGFRGFSQSLQVNAAIIARTRHDCCSSLSHRRFSN
jgi:hypothetical protein